MGLLSANANMNFFGQQIFTIMNIQIIAFPHLNIQTIVLLPVPGFTDCRLGLDILDDICELYHYNPLSQPRLGINVLQGVIIVIDVSHKMCGDRAGINNDSQFTQFTLNIC